PNPMHRRTSPYHTLMFYIGFSGPSTPNYTVSPIMISSYLSGISMLTSVPAGRRIQQACPCLLPIRRTYLKKISPCHRVVIAEYYLWFMMTYETIYASTGAEWRQW